MTKQTENSWLGEESVTVPSFEPINTENDSIPNSSNDIENIEVNESKWTTNAIKELQKKTNVMEMLERDMEKIKRALEFMEISLNKI